MLATVAGLAAGFIHVLAGPDHLAAVAPLSATCARGQWRAGLQWGLGHTSGVLIIGLMMIAFRQALPIEPIAAYSERLVGLVLVGIGLWGGAKAARPQPHVHPSGSASFAMGVLHGLAGSSHLFGVLPALALPSELEAALYLAGFGAGAIVAMTAFSAVIGAVAVGAARYGVNAYRGLLYSCAVSAVLVGGVWLVV